MHSITLIIAFIARLFSFSEKKLFKSEIIVVTSFFLFLFYVNLCRCDITCETLVNDTNNK